MSNLQWQRYMAIASCVLMLAKFWAYHLTKSVAVLTDALESIVNVAAGFVGLYSLYVAAKPRDIDHPYGHGKAEYISAAIEGTMVLSAGVLIIYTAVQNLLHPPFIYKLDTGMWVLAATAAVNWLMGYFSLRKGRQNNSPALVASGKHLQTDTFSTIAILAGLGLLIVTGLVWIDSAVALCFGLYIIYSGYRIIRLSLAGIMDEADMQLLQKLVSGLNAARKDAWVDLHNLRVIKYGNVLHVDCHLTVPWYFNVNEAHAEIEQLAAHIRGDFGEHLELFVHSDACRYFQCAICRKKECPVRKHSFENLVPWTLSNALQDEKHSAKELAGVERG